MKCSVGHAEEVVAAVGAEMDGIVVTAMVVVRGVSRHDVESLRRRGLLVKVARGVDRLRDHPFTWRSRCRALLAVAGDGAALGVRSAARLHGLYRYRSVEDVEVVVPRGRDQRTPLGRIVQSRSLPPEHIVVIDGMPATTLARTFFDLCGDPDFGLPVAHPAHEQAMIRVYNDALGRRGLTFVQEAAMLLVLARRGRPGTQLVRTILERFGPRYVPTRSETETLAFELFNAFGLPEPEKQVVIADEQGFIGTVDFAWRAPKVVAEVDSSWHDGPLDQEVDEERDRRLVAAGYEVIRCRYGDIVLRPAAFARKLGVALRRYD